MSSGAGADADGGLIHIARMPSLILASRMPPICSRTARRATVMTNGNGCDAYADNQVCAMSGKTAPKLLINGEMLQSGSWHAANGGDFNGKKKRHSATANGNEKNPRLPHTEFTYP